MALSRVKKAEKVRVLAKELETSTSAIVGTFKGLTASKDFDLRKTVREAGGSYHVVKNKLAAKASEGSKIAGALQGLKGVSAVAYTSGDPVALAKALSAWVKENAEFTFKLGIVDGKVITVEEVAALATMPGKEELYAKLLFLIQSPAQRLATVINATGRDLAVVLGQGVEKEKFTAAPVAPAAAPVEAMSPVEARSNNNPPDPSATAEAGSVDAVPTELPTPEEAVSPEQQIAEHPASEADPVAESAPTDGDAGLKVEETASTSPTEG